MKISLALFALCLSTLACAGADIEQTPYGEVTGDVTDNGGNDIRFGNVLEGDTVEYSGLACGGSGQEAVLAISLATRVGYCGALQASAGFSSSEIILLDITGLPATSGGPAPTIGLTLNTFGVGAQQDANGNTFTASITLAVFDGECDQEDLFADSGTIQLSAITNAGEVQGTFVANFGSNDGASAGGSLSGNFDTLLCDVTTTQFCAGSSNQCIQ